jgi:hypothetical protein
MATSSPSPSSEPPTRRAIRKRSFRCRGINSIAIRARWPGGFHGAGPFEAIVCITRGGLVPAAIVARELGIG